MKILIVEDDFTSRKVMQKMLASYGECDIAVNGKEAFDAFIESEKTGERYGLIFLDIMMPEMSGHEVLSKIREWESAEGVKCYNGVKIVITTTLRDKDSFSRAFKDHCEGYLFKPIEKEKLAELLGLLGIKQKS